MELWDSNSRSYLLGGIPLVLLGVNTYLLAGIVLEGWLILSSFALSSSREGLPSFSLDAGEDKVGGLSLFIDWVGITFSLGAGEDKVGGSLFINWVGIESSWVVTGVESSSIVTGVLLKNWRLIERLRSDVSWLVSWLLIIEDGFSCASYVNSEDVNQLRSPHVLSP